jgi:hypothetical protein
MGNPPAVPPAGDFNLNNVESGAAIADIKRAAGIPTALIPGLTAAAAPARVLALKPGKERWPVKTGTDRDIALVDKTKVVQTTVEEMAGVPRPSDMQPPTQEFSVYQDQRSEPVETTVWQLEATVTTLKLEADGDYHLVLQGDSGKTIIGEIPTPKPPFVATTSPFLPYLVTARKAVDVALGPQVAAARFALMGKTNLPLTASVYADALPAKTLALVTPVNEGDPPQEVFEMRIQQKKATITGVGFFDRVHGQTGVSLINGIELHPILKIEFH